ncbi:MAG: peptidoglycan/xylan/chitin deacetylase (PgdA/CDA1 family) [Myxococcota bacterium]
MAIAYAVVTGVSVLVFGPSLASIGIPTLVLFCLVTDGIVRPASGVLVPVVTRVGPALGAVALTFDDGPDPQFTPQLLDVLARYDARATFFCIGRHIEREPDLARRIAATHELANHSYAHSRLLNFRGVRHMEAEIRRGEAAIRQVLGTVEPEGPSLYRPPVGLKNPPLAAVANRLGLTVVAWSIHSRDTRESSAQTIASRVLSRVRAGDIILMHDGCDRGSGTDAGAGRSATVEAVELILDGLSKKGLRSATVSELITPNGVGR